MSAGVFTPDLRVNWIMLTTSELGDVGDGTAYPIEVTLDQIAEIFYRVKDAYFTGGRANYGTGDPLLNPEGGFEITAPTTAPSQRASESGEVRRGYTTPVESGTETISAHNDPYLDEEYDAGSSEMYRDILDNERGIWMRGEAGVTLPRWDALSGERVIGGSPFPEITNAFSFHCGDSFTPATASDCFNASGWTNASPGSPIVQTEMGPIQARVYFNTNIAVICANAGDDISASTNQYFVGFELYVADVADIVGLGSIMEVSTNEASITNPVPLLLADQTTPCRYVMKLESGDVTCPLYIADAVGGGTYPFQFGEDFVQEAVEWFPYAKNNPAEAVWNSGTGAKL